MRRFRYSLALSLLAGVLAVTSGQAQQNTGGVPPCVSDWACGSVRPPLGFYVDTVLDGGRYVRLDDGTIWEVQLDHRAAVAGWQRDNFVTVRRIAAPTGDYEWLFTKVADPEWHAAVRFAGWVRH